MCHKNEIENLGWVQNWLGGVDWAKSLCILLLIFLYSIGFVIRWWTLSKNRSKCFRRCFHYRELRNKVVYYFWIVVSMGIHHRCCYVFYYCRATFFDLRAVLFWCWSEWKWRKHNTTGIHVFIGTVRVILKSSNAFLLSLSSVTTSTSHN